jgi:hypothetical protein
MLSSLESNCAPPRNVNDADIHIDTKELPPSQSTDVFMDSSFLLVSARSLGIRKKMCALATNLQSSLGVQDTLSHVEALQGCLERIPGWTVSRCLQARTLLDLQLRQFLVSLHAARAVETETKWCAERRYSVVSLLEAATTTVLHTALTASSNLSLCCTRRDYYRAALLVCHVTYYASKINGKLSRVSHECVANEGLDSMLAQVAKVAFDSCLYQALRLQEE